VVDLTLIRVGLRFKGFLEEWRCNQFWRNRIWNWLQQWDIDVLFICYLFCSENCM